MSTSSLIALKEKDDKYTAVFCHFNGFPAGVGQTLAEHYNTVEKMKELLSLGYLFYLTNSIEKPAGHSFEHPVEGYSVFYGRDRGQTNVEANVFNTLKDLLNYFSNGDCEYLYIFIPEENHFVYYIHEYDMELIDSPIVIEYVDEGSMFISKKMLLQYKGNLIRLITDNITSNVTLVFESDNERIEVKTEKNLHEIIPMMVEYLW